MNYKEIESLYTNLIIGKDCQGNLIRIGDTIVTNREGSRVKEKGIVRYDPSDFSFKVLFNDGENHRIKNENEIIKIYG